MRQNLKKTTALLVTVALLSGEAASIPSSSNPGLSRPTPLPTWTATEALSPRALSNRLSGIHIRIARLLSGSAVWSPNRTRIDIPLGLRRALPFIKVLERPAAPRYAIDLSGWIDPELVKRHPKSRVFLQIFDYTSGTDPELALSGSGPTGIDGSIVVSQNGRWRYRVKAQWPEGHRLMARVSFAGHQAHGGMWTLDEQQQKMGAERASSSTQANVVVMKTLRAAAGAVAGLAGLAALLAQTAGQAMAAPLSALSLPHAAVQPLMATTAQLGEGPIAIARRLGVSLQKLIEANPQWLDAGRHAARPVEVEGQKIFIGAGERVLVPGDGAAALDWQTTLSHLRDQLPSLDVAPASWTDHLQSAAQAVHHTIFSVHPEHVAIALAVTGAGLLAAWLLSRRGMRLRLATAMLALLSFISPTVTSLAQTFNRVPVRDAVRSRLESDKARRGLKEEADRTAAARDSRKPLVTVDAHVISEAPGFAGQPVVPGLRVGTGHSFRISYQPGKAELKDAVAREAARKEADRANEQILRIRAIRSAALRYRAESARLKALQERRSATSDADLQREWDLHISQALARIDQARLEVGRLAEVPLEEAETIDWDATQLENLAVLLSPVQEEDQPAEIAPGAAMHDADAVTPAAEALASRLKGVKKQSERSIANFLMKYVIPSGIATPSVTFNFLSATPFGWQNMLGLANFLYASLEKLDLERARTAWEALDAELEKGRESDIEALTQAVETLRHLEQDRAARQEALQRLSELLDRETDSEVRAQTVRTLDEEIAGLQTLDIAEKEARWRLEEADMSMPAAAIDARVAATSHVSAAQSKARAALDQVRAEIDRLAKVEAKKKPAPVAFEPLGAIAGAVGAARSSTVAPEYNAESATLTAGFKISIPWKSKKVEAWKEFRAGVQKQQSGLANNASAGTRAARLILDYYLRVADGRIQALQPKPTDIFAGHQVTMPNKPVQFTSVATSVNGVTNRLWRLFKRNAGDMEADATAIEAPVLAAIQDLVRETKSRASATTAWVQFLERQPAGAAIGAHLTKAREAQLKAISEMKAVEMVLTQLPEADGWPREFQPTERFRDIWSKVTAESPRAALDLARMELRLAMDARSPAALMHDLQMLYSPFYSVPGAPAVRVFGPVLYFSWDPSAYGTSKEALTAARRLAQGNVEAAERAVAYRDAEVRAVLTSMGERAEHLRRVGLLSEAVDVESERADLFASSGVPLPESTDRFVAARRVLRFNAGATTKGLLEQPAEERERRRSWLRFVGPVSGSAYYGDFGNVGRSFGVSAAMNLVSWDPGHKKAHVEAERAAQAVVERSNRDAARETYYALARLQREQQAAIEQVTAAVARRQRLEYSQRPSRDALAQAFKEEDTARQRLAVNVIRIAALAGLPATEAAAGQTQMAKLGMAWEELTLPPAPTIIASRFTTTEPSATSVTSAPAPTEESPVIEQPPLTTEGGSLPGIGAKARSRTFSPATVAVREEAPEASVRYASPEDEAALLAEYEAQAPQIDGEVVQAHWRQRAKQFVNVEWLSYSVLNLMVFLTSMAAMIGLIVTRIRGRLKGSAASLLLLAASLSTLNAKTISGPAEPDRRLRNLAKAA